MTGIDNRPARKSGIMVRDNDLESHCDAVRLEAAHALARWQMHHAPLSSSAEGSWHGLGTLLRCYKGLFFDDDGLPLENDFHNSNPAAMEAKLKPVLTVAAALVKAKNGYTPGEVRTAPAPAYCVCACACLRACLPAAVTGCRARFSRVVYVPMYLLLCL